MTMREQDATPSAGEPDAYGVREVLTGEVVDATISRRDAEASARARFELNEGVKEYEVVSLRLTPSRPSLGEEAREKNLDWRKRAEEAEARLLDLGERPYTLEEMRDRTEVRRILATEAATRQHNGPMPCVKCGARTGQSHAITCANLRALSSDAVRAAKYEALTEAIDTHRTCIVPSKSAVQVLNRLAEYAESVRVEERALLAAPTAEPVAWRVDQTFEDGTPLNTFVHLERERAERVRGYIADGMMYGTVTSLYAAAPVGDARDTERPTHNPRED
jgi:hypothetical protein